MREIKFRGYSKKYEKWVYGCLDITADGKYFIKEINERGASQRTRVEESSIGQFTDQKDRYGNEIYEGDKVDSTVDEEYFYVEWDEDTSMFVMFGDGTVGNFDCYYGREFTVIGNRYEERKRQ